MEEEVKTKKSKKGLLAIIILVIIAAIVGGVYLYSRKTSAKDKFVGLIEKPVSELEKQAKKLETLKTSTEITAKLETNDESLKQYEQIVNKLTMNTAAEIDYNKLTALAKLNLKYDGKDILNAKEYADEGFSNLYLYVDGLFDKYFKISADKYLKQNENLDADYETIGRIAIETVKDNLKDEYFSQENVDGLEKITLNMTKKDIEEMVYNVIKDLEKDEKFLGAFGKDSENVKTALEEMIKDYDEEKKNAEYDEEENAKTYIKASVYKNRSKELVKLEAQVVVDEDTMLNVLFDATNKENITAELSAMDYYKATFEKTANKAELKLLEYDEEVFSIVINKIDENKFEIKLAAEENEIIANVNKVAENNYKYTLTAKTKTYGHTATMELFDGTIKVEKLENGQEKLELVFNIPELGKITLNINSKVEENVELEAVDVSNNVDIDNLTDADTQKIYSNLQKMPIYSLINTMLQQYYMNNYSYYGY